MKDLGSDRKFGFLVLVVTVLSIPFVFIAPKIIPFLMSLVFFIVGTRQILSYRELRHWVEVPADLLQTEIGTFEEAAQYGSFIYYFPLAYFSYNFEGQIFKSNNYAFDRKSVWSLEKLEIDEKLVELNEAKSLNGFVNPVNPSEAVLNREIGRKRWEHSISLLIIGGLLMAFGFWFASTSQS